MRNKFFLKYENNPSSKLVKLKIADLLSSDKLEIKLSKNNKKINL